MDWDPGGYADGLETLVGGDPIAEGRVKKCEMVEAGAALRFLDQSRDCRQSDTVMLLVVGHKDKKIVLVQTLRVEYGLVPFHHFFETGRPQHRVGELRGGYSTSAVVTP